MCGAGKSEVLKIFAGYYQLFGPAANGVPSLVCAGCCHENAAPRFAFLAIPQEAFPTQYFSFYR